MKNFINFDTTFLSSMFCASLCHFLKDKKQQCQGRTQKFERFDSVHLNDSQMAVDLKTTPGDASAPKETYPKSCLFAFGASDFSSLFGLLRIHICLIIVLYYPAFAVRQYFRILKGNPSLVDINVIIY